VSLRHGNVTLPELEDGCRKALQNATDLLVDAQLLADGGGSPRAYALAHLALEELSKVTMLFRVGSQIQSGAEIDWKHLEKRFRSHKHKFWGSAFSAYVAEDRPAEQGAEELLSDLSTAADHLSLKEAALYVDMTSDGFTSPSERITSDATNALIKRAAAQVEFFRETLPIVLTSYYRDLTAAEKRMVTTMSRGDVPFDQALALLTVVRDVIRRDLSTTDGEV